MINKLKPAGIKRGSFSKNFVISLIMVLSLVLIIVPAAASIPGKQQVPDSTTQNLQEPLKSYENFNADYLQKVEIEHQKLLRNIFAASFFFLLALLIFTMVFYGSKIKKVSNIIVLQDEALKSTKDQLIKIINIFNYIDQQVYITDSKGIIEWINAYGTNFFTEKYEETQINLVSRFSTENQGNVLKGINDQVLMSFKDKMFNEHLAWKMIPIKNSKGEFSNMVFIC